MMIKKIKIGILTGILVVSMVLIGATIGIIIINEPNIPNEPPKTIEYNGLVIQDGFHYKDFLNQLYWCPYLDYLQVGRFDATYLL